MEIKYIVNKNEWNEFLEKQKYSQILQSWDWGGVQENVGNKIFRIGVEEKNELIAAATLIKKNLPMGASYFFCPRGPIFNFRFSILDFQFNPLKLLFEEIEKLAKKEGVVFLRLEPAFTATEALQACSDSVAVKKTIDIEPSKTLMLDLGKSEEELLKEMHQKTRYNIRLAEKKGIKVVEGKKYFEGFWKIANQTGNRDNFRLHSKEYYQKMLECENIKLFAAEFDSSTSLGQNKIITANIVSFFGDTVSYLHGASSDEYRNLKAPCLLQWHIIKSAKEDGYKYYDFFGIDEKKWPGVTRFKKGFGGFEIQFPGTFDLVFNKSYYSIYKLIRKIKRKL